MSSRWGVINFWSTPGGAVAQLGARLDGIEEVVGSNPIGSTKKFQVRPGHMAEYIGYIGNTFGPNGFSIGSKTRVSRSKYPRS